MLRLFVRRRGPPQLPAAQVGVVTIQPENQPITTELSGRTRARLSAEIRPQVGGIVQQRLFEEGALVKAGQVLYQLDPATYKASYASAQASVAKAEATVNSAKVTARRNAELAKIDAVSQQSNDDSQATAAPGGGRPWRWPVPSLDARASTWAAHASPRRSPGASKSPR